MNRPLQTGIIKEIEIRLRHFLSICQSNRTAAWNIRFVQLIVHFYNHLIAGVVAYNFCDIGRKRQKTALTFIPLT